MNFCAGYQYFGLQWHSYCYCGDDYGSFGPAESEDECDTPCRGDATTMCGGGWRHSVYEITGQETQPRWSDWVSVSDIDDDGDFAVECAPQTLGVDDPAEGDRKDCECSESGTGD